MITILNRIRSFKQYGTSSLSSLNDFHHSQQVSSPQSFKHQHQHNHNGGSNSKSSTSSSSSSSSSLSMMIQRTVSNHLNHPTTTITSTHGVTTGSSNSKMGMINMMKFNHNNNNHKIRQRSSIEKYGILCMLLITWMWIIITIGTVLYHGYYGQPLPGLLHHEQQQQQHEEQVEDEKIHKHKLNEAEEAEDKQQEEDRHLIIPTMLLSSNNNNNNNNNNVNSQQQEQQQHVLQLPPIPGRVPIPNYDTPLIVFTCSRAEYLNETLFDILQYIPRNCIGLGCPIIISQDGTNSDVENIIHDYIIKFRQEKNIPVIHIQHPKNNKIRNQYNPYQLLSIHYKWALTRIFDGQLTIPVSSSSTITTTDNNKQIQQPKPKYVLILEEDIHIAIDFFRYFERLQPLYEQDDSIFAISAFNDNGYHNTVYNATRVLRSDFFPGLGWMLSSKIWYNEQYNSNWPFGYWDDWLREPQQRKNRIILHPEISRTYHFGTKGGASSNQFGQQLQSIQLNKQNINWNEIDITYLQSSTLYNQQYYDMIHKSYLVTSIPEMYQYVESIHSTLPTNTSTITTTPPPPPPLEVVECYIRIEYHTLYEFQQLVHQLKIPLMSDEKAGILRTAYKGIVETRIILEKTSFVTTTTTTTKYNTNHNNNKNDENNNMIVETNHCLFFFTPPIQTVQKELLGNNKFLEES